MIWVLVAMMAAATVLGLIWPLGRSKGAPSSRNAQAMAIYEDQLGELDRDAERGLITAEEARAAQVEIKRRMLSSGVQATPSAPTSGRLAIVLAALFVPLAGFALYNQVGSPNTVSIPFAERGDEQQEARQMQALIAELRSRLEADPQGGETRGWELLGSTLMNMGNPRDAADAFSQVVERPDATSATWSQYAEALILAETGVVTPLAGRAITRAQELDPDNPAATYYRAIELEQAGDTAQARQLLLDRITREGQPAPWIDTLLAAANQMGTRIGLDPVAAPDAPERRGPNQEDMDAAAEMTPEERQDFIRSMVDGLETRLQDTPDDLDGWLQLARALVVLGENERALSALQSAEPLVADLPETDQRRLLVQEGLKQFAAPD